MQFAQVLPQNFFWASMEVAEAAEAAEAKIFQKKSMPQNA